MAVMRDQKYFSQGNYGLAEMHPIRNDLVTRPERFARLSIERVKCQVAYRRRPEFGHCRRTDTSDRTRLAGKWKRTLQRLFAGLDRVYHAVCHNRGIGHSQIRRCPL